MNDYRPPNGRPPNNKSNKNRQPDNIPLKRKRTPAQKVLIVLIVIFVIILIALLTLVLRDVFSLGSDSSPIRDIIARSPEPQRTPATAAVDDEEDEEEEEPEPEPDFTGVNPLTGAPMDENNMRNRPVAVVLNNIQQALPMNGVSKADIIYEYAVEGGITRMLALYQDATYVGLIGSIRSARHYTVQLAESYDAILVAAGRSPQANTEVNALKIPFLNEVEGPLRDVFYRDRNRIPGRRVDSVHSVVTSGDRLAEWLPQYNFRLLHESGYKHTLSFVEDGAPARGASATEAVVSFSAGKTTTFIYDSAESAYYARQAGSDFIDANDKSRPNFANILVIKTRISGISGDDAGRLNIETTGSGSGYFISGGKYIEIEWMRAGKSDPFIYIQKDGSPVQFGIGKTYICVIPTNMDAAFK